MKVFFKDKHVKTLPKKYKPLFIEGGGEMFKNDKFKRLTKQQRFVLECKLLKHNLSCRFTRELIEKEQVLGVGLVETNEGTSYYVALFGKYKVKCSKMIFDLSENQYSYKRTM